MKRLHSVLLAIVLLAVVTSGARGGQPGPPTEVRAVPQTRAVRIPLKPLSLPDVAQSSNADAGTLLFTPGAEDELPEGPDGFDVLEDGNILITDPLRDSISMFDAQGKFKGAWKIGFAADSITALASGLILVREANTGQLHAFDREGKPRPAEGAVLPQPAEARILGEQSGTVARQGGGTIEVQFDQPGLRLLSLESLGTDAQGNTYVAMETTAGGSGSEDVNLNKYIRKYSADGKLVSEVVKVPLDYYIVPVDELRVRKGVVYQLTSDKLEVRINVWDMN